MTFLVKIYISPQINRLPRYSKWGDSQTAIHELTHEEHNQCDQTVKLKVAQKGAKAVFYVKR